MRCFAHVVNLIAKSFLKLFDPITKKKSADEYRDEEVLGGDAWEETLLDDIDRALEELEAGIDEEENISIAEQDGHGRAMGADNLEGFIDERDDLEEEERASLASQLRPVRLALAKVIDGYTLHQYT